MSPNRDGTPPTPPARSRLAIRALVAGLSPQVMPMIIRDIARDGMSLEFEDHASAVDERWATPGAGVLVFFVSVIDGQRKRTSVFGRIRQREAHGLVVRLLGLEEDTVEALNYLLSLSGAKRAKATPPPAPAVSNATVLAECGALLRRYAPLLAAHYLDGVVIQLQGLKAQAGAAAEHKKYSSMLMELNAARARLDATMQTRSALALDNLFRHDQSALSNGEGSLSLVESIDLRSSLAVMEAIHEISTRLRSVWLACERALQYIVPPRTDLTAVAPGTLCHQIRDTIYFDEHLTRLRQVDLTKGFSEPFIAALEALYTDMSAVFARHGVGPGGDGSAWNQRD
ncbi:MAG: DUF1631 family protein [Gammaproteobacteria bacterium]|nr:DUF1631 family protein [Gammaproteobacteria bacterium]